MRALEARALRRPDLPPLLMHIGINTGLVIAGTVGDGTQFGVMGDTVNTAARLMDKAVKRQTFVSAETARRIRHQFLLTDMGQYQMKGKDLPVQAFMLERQLSAAEAKEARRLHAPLIGRDEELSALRSAAARTTTGPDGAVALVLGDAGMGKTRLLDELAADIAADMFVLRGSGQSVGARPFGLIAEVLEPLIAEMTAGPDKTTAATILTGGETADIPELGAALGRALAHAASSLTGRDPGRSVRARGPGVGGPRGPAHAPGGNGSSDGRACVATRRRAGRSDRARRALMDHAAAAVRSPQ